MKAIKFEGRTYKVVQATEIKVNYIVTGNNGNYIFYVNNENECVCVRSCYCKYCCEV